MDPIFDWKGGDFLSGTTANRPKIPVEIFAIGGKLQNYNAAIPYAARIAMNGTKI